MYKKFILACFALLFTGCSWLAILDTRQCDDEGSSARRRSKVDLLNAKYNGANYDQIRKDFGPPRRIEKAGKILVLVDKECARNWVGVMHWGDCEAGKADEVWEYEYKERDRCGLVFYSQYIAFVDGKVFEIR